MKIPKLKTPLWQELVYLIFVGVIPIVITCIELFNSRSVVLQISIASIGAVFITYFVIKKFILNKYIDKVKQRIVMLEHDYSIACGNPLFIKKQWKIYNSIIYLLNTVQSILALTIIYLFIKALVDQLIAFKGAATIILISVILGMAFKAFCYISMKVEDNNG